jgi:hypothetical protein
MGEHDKQPNGTTPAGEQLLYDGYSGAERGFGREEEDPDATDQQERPDADQSAQDPRGYEPGEDARGDQAPDSQSDQGQYGEPHKGPYRPDQGNQAR